MLTLLLSLTALAGPVPDRIAGEAVPWDVEQVRAAMRIEIAAPPGLGKQQEDDTLRNQLRAKTEAVKQVVDVLTAAMAQHEAEVDIAALTTLAAVEEDFSRWHGEFRGPTDHVIPHPIGGADVDEPVLSQ